MSEGFKMSLKEQKYFEPLVKLYIIIPQMILKIIQIRYMNNFII